jgi:hypothetical protein
MFLFSMKKILITALFLFAVTVSQSVSAQSSTSPIQSAERFYRTYLKLKIRGLPKDNELKILSPLITPDLKELFVRAREIQEKYNREHPDEKPPWADGDLFTSLFEGAQSFRLGSPKRNADQVEVPVHLAYREGGSTTRWSDVIILVREKNRWLVRDILLQGEWGFKSGYSLRSILSSR